jgi:hypothetical protein
MRYWPVKALPYPDRRQHDMADQDHKHGEMDISEQEKTFAGFMRMSVNVGLISIGIVIVLAIFFR